MAGPDLGGIFKKVVPNAGSTDELQKGVAGALGKMVGGKINEAAKPAVDGANAKINEGKDAVMGFVEKAKLMTSIGIAKGRLPDALPLDGPNAKNFTTFVESALNQSGFTKVTVDGKPDKNTLEAVNKLRQEAGKEPLAKVGDFTKEDLTLVIDKLESTKTQGATNVLKQVPEMLNGVRESNAFPEPAKPAKAVTNDFNNGG